jgi:hypothetical protein
MVDQLAWHRIGTITSATDWVRDVVGFAKGYVALGDEHVWFSRDGRDWTTVELAVDRPGVEGPPGGLGSWAMASDGDVVVIVAGWFDPDPSVDRAQAISWVTDDGSTWRGGVPGGPDTAGLDAVWSDGTGGWDAGEIDDTAGAGPAPLTIWHSADGLTWKKHGVLGDGPIDGGVGGGASDAQGRRVVWPAPVRVLCDGDGCAGSYWAASVATSDDGQSWASADGVPGPEAGVMAGAARGGSRMPWVLVGWGATDEGEEATAWSSIDGRTWTVHRLGDATGGEPEVAVSSADDVVLTDRGYVAVGATEGGGHETWVSDDGATWVRQPPREDGGADFGPGLVADGPAGVIGLGETASDDELAVWRLGPAEAAAQPTAAPAPTPAPSTTAPAVPPMPSGVAFENVSTGTCPSDPQELCSIDEQVVTVSWKAPRTEGVEIRVYGITACFGTDEDGAVIDGRCLRKHTTLPDGAMLLLATTDASEGSVTFTGVPSATGLVDTTDGTELYSIVVASYDARGRPSVFAIAATGEYCIAAELPCPEE